ncbi:MAG: lytic transglycosylase domain-containing protein [bacterium]|nr:lytic transglycosylase domain-containing protein [bacterium]
MSYFSAGFHIGMIDGLCRNFFGFSPAFTMPCWSMPIWSAPCCCSNPFGGWLGFNLGFNIGSLGMFSRPQLMPPVPTLTPPAYTMPQYQAYNEPYWNNSSIWQTNNQAYFMPMDTYSFSSNKSSVKSEGKDNIDKTINETGVKKESGKKVAQTGQTNPKDNIVVQKANRTKIGGPKTKYDDLIVKYANKYDLDPNLVKALITQESSFDPNIRSPKGAIGLMQLMPDTAVGVGVADEKDTIEQNTAKRKDPEKNIAGGTKYLREMMDRYHGNIELAIAAYKAGPRNVKNSIPDNGETPNHVKKVMQYYKEYSSNIA